MKHLEQNKGEKPLAESGITMFHAENELWFQTQVDWIKALTADLLSSIPQIPICSGTTVDVKELIQHIEAAELRINSALHPDEHTVSIDLPSTNEARLLDQHIFDRLAASAPLIEVGEELDVSVDYDHGDEYRIMYSRILSGDDHEIPLGMGPNPDSTNVMVADFPLASAGEDVLIRSWPLLPSLYEELHQCLLMEAKRKVLEYQVRLATLSSATAMEKATVIKELFRRLQEDLSYCKNEREFGAFISVTEPVLNELLSSWSYERIRLEPCSESRCLETAAFRALEDKAALVDVIEDVFWASFPSDSHSLYFGYARILDGQDEEIELPFENRPIVKLTQFERLLHCAEDITGRCAKAMPNLLYAMEAQVLSRLESS